MDMTQFMVIAVKLLGQLIITALIGGVAVAIISMARDISAMRTSLHSIAHDFSVIRECIKNLDDIADKLYYGDDLDEEDSSNVEKD